MSRPRQRVPAVERRRLILVAAARLFAQRGFQGTTTRRIADEARVNEAILFRHFPTKKELYWAVIEAKCEGRPARAMLVERLKAGCDEKAAFAAVAQGMLERQAADTSLMRLLLFSGLEEHELSARFFQTYAAGYYELLADYIRARIKAGAFRAIDPLLAARSFLGMVVYHSMVQELFGGKRYRNYDSQCVAETLTAIWLEGMKAR
jgi:AcrR family transcriptional regulator